MNEEIPENETPPKSSNELLVNEVRTARNRLVRHTPHRNPIAQI